VAGRSRTATSGDPKKKKWEIDFGTGSKKRRERRDEASKDITRHSSKKAGAMAPPLVNGAWGGRKKGRETQERERKGKGRRS